jgi:hypothetical protein
LSISWRRLAASREPNWQTDRWLARSCPKIDFPGFQSKVPHLLKSQYQPERISKSWRSSIKEQARKILVLNDSPSLEREMPTFMRKAYPEAGDKASEETERPIETFFKMTDEFERAVEMALIGKPPDFSR